MFSLDGTSISASAAPHCGVAFEVREGGQVCRQREMCFGYKSVKIVFSVPLYLRSEEEDNCADS